ncbi:MAG: hypothetical protein ACI4JF_02100 [Oscillospiraceae bacterium]
MSKIFAAVTVEYAMSPLTLSTILWSLDDLIIFPTLAAVTIKCIPKDKPEEYRVQAESL